MSKVVIEGQKENDDDQCENRDFGAAVARDRFTPKPAHCPSESESGRSRDEKPNWTRYEALFVVPARWSVPPGWGKPLTLISSWV